MYAQNARKSRWLPALGFQGFPLQTNWLGFSSFDYRNRLRRSGADGSSAVEGGDMQKQKRDFPAERSHSEPRT
jgi:hypothetical protein